MLTREFHAHDQTVASFWRITLTGPTCTVQFGRIGTPGQSQTTTFPDAQAAQLASEQQIAEKLAQGYHEVDVANNNPQDPSARSMPSFLRRLATAVLARFKPGTPAAEPQPEPIGTIPPGIAPIAQPAAPATHDPGLRLNLDPTDWFWATWRRPFPLKRPAAAPFDRTDALQRLRQLASSMDELHWKGYWKWETVIPEVMTPQEARFWLQALQAKCEAGQIDSATLADRLGTTAARSSISREEAFAIALRMQRSAHPRMIALLAALFSPQEIMTRLIQASHLPLPGFPDHYDSIHDLIEGFHRYVLPYLTHRERDQLSQTLTPHLKHVHWPSYSHAGHPALYFAAVLGGHNDVLRRIVEGWAEDGRGWHRSRTQFPQRIIFGLDDPREVEAQFRRLKLPLSQPGCIRAWLAHTEDRALDLVYAAVKDTTDRDVAAALTSTFALVAAPAAAPYMLLLTQESKAPQVASAWIDAHPAHTIAGLLPLAQGRGAQAEVAIEILRRLARRGYGEQIEQALTALPQETAARLRANIIQVAQPSLPAFEAQTTPAWLAEALRAPVKSKAQLPAWTRVADRLPVVIDGHVLSLEQVGRLLQVMKQGRAGTEHPLIQGVRQHADQTSLDHFVWELFERWLADGAPSKDNWAFFGLGLLGGDSVALKLAPLIRVWPGQSQHQRAVNGLECLRLIGSDTALMQINSIAQKVRFKGLQNRAVECMDQVAADRGLSRARLEDRIVPDCELDARGERIFDYGPRQFRFVLGPDMKPMVRDGQGKLKPNLPPPTSKDDAEQAAQAIAAWKLLKKQVAEVAKVQAVRLEQAMVTGRRWTLHEFEPLLVRHPLLTHLVRTLIWGAYDHQGALVLTFRVTEDQSYADAADTMVVLPADAAIGLMHPLNLPDDERAAWGEILSDYAIVQPFPQLGRAIQRLEAHELTATDITRFSGMTLPSAALVFGLDQLGWTRDLPSDGGGIFGHFKPFYHANLTAVIRYRDGVAPGWIVDAPDQKLVYVAVVLGIRQAERYPVHTERLVLGAVDPVVISEVVNDLLALAAKAM